MQMRDTSLSLPHQAGGRSQADEDIFRLGRHQLPYLCLYCIPFAKLMSGLQQGDERSDLVTRRSGATCRRISWLPAG